ncbi:MAG TPA: I78 family peptidase inhibitor [Erythrobacter sp.]|nr:I78 family peptidase inhibitor [Erythrobacter sp.]
MMRKKVIALIAMPLAACAGYAEPDTAPPAPQASAPAERVCDAAAAQGHIGHDAPQAMGAAILKDSGAQTLRWGPPKAAWTMDYRRDRVNVRYDDQMKITAITCG